MNFFKSVFSDDPDPPGTESESDSPKHSEEDPTDESNPEHDDNEGGGWSFGGLMKTIADRSESVIETYRRDLEEFGTGLKKEIEVAQGSLGTVGLAIDELGNTVLKGTAEIIAQGKEAILAAGNESDSSSTDNTTTTSLGRRDSFSSKPYSRLDAQVRSVQGDLNTYSEEPEDSDDYNKWESEFSLGDKTEEMESLLEGNGDMKGVYRKVVPSLVDHETFWFRYYYKVHKLKQAEDLRVNLVKRAISLDDEEELSWDIDDEEESSEIVVESAATDISKLKKLEGNSGDVSKAGKDDQVTSADSVSNVGLKTDTDFEEKKETGSEEVPESKPVVADTTTPPASDEAPIQEAVKTEAVSKSEESAPSQESAAKPDGAATSSTQKEEDMGWDEIEDMSSIDGKEASRSSGSPNRAELRKRLSAAEEEDEDLSWDIEDDDDEETSPSTKA